MAPLVLEGTWEELAAQVGELAGTGKKITLIIPADEPEEVRAPRPNAAALEALRRVREIQRDMPMTEGSDSVALVREARAGAMYGDDPAD